MARTNLSVDRRVFEEFASQASRKNMTLVAFANETLDTISKIAADGGDPAGLYSIWKVLSLLKQVDAITLPSDFVENLINRVYKEDKGKLLQEFRELGASVVGMLRIAAEDVTSLAQLAKDFCFLIPIKRFEMTNENGGAIKVSVVGAGKKLETTECSSEFLKSILGGYGYGVIKEELHPGTIRLWAQKKNEV